MTEATTAPVLNNLSTGDQALLLTASGDLRRISAQVLQAGGITKYVSSWADLNAIPRTGNNAGAVVRDTDTGTHTDPVTGLTVPNAGTYTDEPAKSPRPAGWLRLGATPDSLIAASQATADLAVTTANTANATANTANTNATAAVATAGTANTNAAAAVVTANSVSGIASSAEVTAGIALSKAEDIADFAALSLPGDHLAGDAVTFVDELKRRLSSIDVLGAYRGPIPAVDELRQPIAVMDPTWSAGFCDDNDGLLLGIRRHSGMVEINSQGEPRGIAYLDSGVVRALMQDGTTIRLSEPGATHSRVVQNGNAVSYVRENDGVWTGVVSRTLASQAPLAPGVTEIWYTPVYGQSNSSDFTGPASPITLAPDAPGRSLMFAEGPVLIPPGAFPRDHDPPPLRLSMFAALRDMESSPRVSNGFFSESPCPGLGWALAQLTPTNIAHIVGTLGIGGAGIESLGKNVSTAFSTGQAYRNVISSVQYAKVIADLQGVPLKVRGVGWIQSETNNATPDATYRPLLVAIQAALDTDIRAITGQTETVLLVCHQTLKKSSVSSLNDVPNVFLDLALTQPDKFMCTGPSYQYTHPDGIHTNGVGKRRTGEQMGRAMARRIINGVTHPMLHMQSASLSGSTITIAIGGAEGDLVWDSAVTNPNTYRGFEFVQTGGNAVSVTGVSISGSNVVMNLSAAPTGSARRVIAAGVGTVTASNPNSGPTTGPRCQLMDSATFLGADGIARTKHLCHQVINVS